MGLYTLYDFKSNEIKITNSDFDTLIFSNILTDLEFTTSPQPYYNGLVHPYNFYDVHLKLEELIDTRMDDTTTLPLELLDRNGASNSVFMLNQGIEWQKMSKKVEPFVKVTNIADDVLVYTLTTFNTTNFTNITNGSFV